MNRQMLLQRVIGVTLIALLTLLMGGCSTVQGVFAKPTPTPTNTPTLTPTNTPTVTDTPTATNTPTNTPTVTDTPTATPTFTPTSTNTPTTTPTDTPTPPPSPDAVVDGYFAAMYSGPGTVYKDLGSVRQEVELEVIGQAYDCAWLKVIIPPSLSLEGTQGWVAVERVLLNLPCDLIPAAPIPPTPTPTPTPTPDTRPTVSIGVANFTGCTLTLTLDGPAQYRFIIEPGEVPVVEVVPGTYSYWSKACGIVSTGTETFSSWSTWFWKREPAPILPPPDFFLTPRP